MAARADDETVWGGAWSPRAGRPTPLRRGRAEFESAATDLATAAAEARALAGDLRALADEVRAAAAAADRPAVDGPPAPVVRWRAPAARAVPAPPARAPAAGVPPALILVLPLPAALALYAVAVAWLDRRAYRPLTPGDAALDLALLALALAGIALLERWRRAT
ncbi:MAG TPA: hypothetical protein VFL91_29505 [Thermomicrobiales bacterium]|nr:hypothetical protein [Thermomicrobiales bacterium]